MGTTNKEEEVYDVITEELIPDYIVDFWNFNDKWLLTDKETIKGVVIQDTIEQRNLKFCYERQAFIFPDHAVKCSNLDAREHEAEYVHIEHAKLNKETGKYYYPF